MPKYYTPKAYIEAVEIQQRLKIDIMDPLTKRSVRAQLAKAWCMLEERKRILRNKPLPGAYRPDMDPARLAKQLRARGGLPMLSAPAYLEVLPTADKDFPAETAGKPLDSNSLKESNGEIRATGKESTLQETRDGTPSRGGAAPCIGLIRDPRSDGDGDSLMEGSGGEAEFGVDDDEEGEDE